MADKYKQILKVNVFPILSVLLAAYFFYAFSLAVGAPPTDNLDGRSLGYLVLAVIFFLAPEIQRFELDKLHDYEGRLQDSKEEILLLKSQLRTLSSAYNGLLASRGQDAESSARVGVKVAAVASSVRLPTPEDAETARQELNSALGEEAEQERLDSEIEHFLNEEDFDIESALWDMRKVIDKELRRVGGQERPNGERSSSSQALFEEFARNHSGYAGMHSAFDYVLQVCDAAVHGREVPAACALEAFHMGFRILDALRKVAPAEASRAA